jgi:pimeloyl-ACP methyl ester carboxylesterase
MHPFTINLPNNGVLTGRHSFPKDANLTYKHLPLIVYIHGASYDAEYYDAEYFDVDAQHSIFTIADQFGIPVIAIDRPGYGGVPHILSQPYNWKVRQ